MCYVTILVDVIEDLIKYSFTNLFWETIPRNKLVDRRELKGILAEKQFKFQSIPYGSLKLILGL